jgi:Flavin reductase like domain
MMGVLVILILPPLAAAFAADSNNKYHQNKIPPLPPLSLPVWSLSCPSIPSSAAASNKHDPSHELPSHSMNIVTFCCGLSVAAPKLFAVSLYYDTLTKDSFFHHQRGVLQLLRPHHKRLVPILGQHSGYNTDIRQKADECAALGFAWHEWNDYQLLPDCALYLPLQLVERVPVGDHELAICQVMDTMEWNGKSISIISPDSSSTGDTTTIVAMPLNPTNTLYTGQLREEGIL